MPQNRRLVASLVLSLVVFALLIAFVGIEEFARTLLTISPGFVVILLVTATAGIVMMGLSFYAITRSLGLGVSPIEAVILYTGIGFANNITPFGQAGGEPIGAMVVSKWSDRPYEECLAAISSLDVINFIPPIIVFVFGGGYLVLVEPVIPNELRPILAGFVVFTLVVTVLGMLARTYPARFSRSLERVVGTVNRWVGRLPRVTELDPASLRTRVGNYTHSIGVVATNRRTVLTAIALSTLAFAAQGVLLWLAMLAVEAHIPLMLAIFIVPVSLLAGVIPLPGGVGGVEGVQLVILVATTGVALAPAATAVVISRGIAYWLPIVLGSVTVSGVYSLRG